MGTNEAANVAAGSNFSYDDRIESMMSTIGDEPVMWVNVKSLVPNGPYAEANMKSWDEALLAACDRYPNMRIYNWAADVKDDWFIPDGIHFTSEGYAARGAPDRRRAAGIVPQHRTAEDDRRQGLCRLGLSGAAVEA